MKDDFGVIIDSLGNTCLSYLDSAGLRRVVIFPDARDETAHVEIYLEDSSWEKRAKAIDVMVELREMFIDDLSMDYCFVDDENVDSSEKVQGRTFVTA